MKDVRAYVSKYIGMLAGWMVIVVPLSRTAGRPRTLGGRGSGDGDTIIVIYNWVASYMYVVRRCKAVQIGRDQLNEWREALLILDSRDRSMQRERQVG